MRVPEGENCPVVIFLHGSHPVEKAAENRYDLGFTYLDGGKLFDELESAEGRVSDAELIYLKEGDHSGFSTALVRPDPFSSQEDRDRVMDRSRQQAFLSAYVKDFADQVLEDGHTPFAGQTELPESYGGCEVLIRVDEESQVLFQAGQETKPDLAAEGVQEEWVNASSTVDNTAGAFRLPGGFTTYDLLRLQWEQPGAAVSIPVSADLGEAGMLQLDLTQDSSDPLNHQKDQSVRVILTDADGKEAAVEIPAGTPALSWQEGETETYPGIGETELSQYSTFTPLGTLRIELSAFQGVDLTHITGITLEFPQDSGSVMLREIEAVG